jgi:two-component system CheB/CheR fusion protein
LQTVNVELQGKLEELSRANDDMTNLLNATDIATIFLDNQLHIKRHTEQAKRIIRLISSDVGRSIGDLVLNLRYENLVSDAQEVLRTLVFKEAEVRGEGDEWYLMRILPYRTMENMIDGLVITFVDITRIKKLQQDETRIAHALQNSPVCIYGQDPLLRVTWSCGVVFGRRQLDVLGKTDSDFMDEDIALELAQIKAEVLRTRDARQHRFVMGQGSRSQSYSIFMDVELSTDGSPHGISCVVAELPKG